MRWTGLAVRAVVSGALLFGAGPAAAADPTVEELGEMTLEELLQVTVTSATRNERQLADVPAKVYLVTEETIRIRGYRTLADVLQDLPEVQVAFRAQEEAPTAVTIRGIAGNDKFLILRDGVRASAVSGRPEPILQGYSLFDVKRIEVVLGPASSLYGAGAFAGVINIITKSGADLQGFAVSGSYGMFHTTHDAVTWGDQFGLVQLSASAQLHHSEEPDLSRSYPDDYAAYLDFQETGIMEGFAGPVELPREPWSLPIDATSVNVKASLSELEVSYFLSSQRWVPTYSATPSQTLFSDEFHHYRDYREIIALRHRYQTSGERPITFDSSLARTSSWLDSDSGFQNLFTNYVRTYKKEWGNQVTLQEMIDFQLAEGYNLTVGLTYDDLTGMPNGADLDRPYDGSVPIGSQEALYPGTNIPVIWNINNEQNIGATVQLQAELIPAVKVTLGSRYDYNRRYGSTINPRAGVVLQPISGLTTKILYGEAFLAPTPFVSFQHYGSFYCTSADDCAGGFFQVPNTELRPEKLRTGEISTIYAWTPEVLTSVSAFYSHVADRIEIAGQIRNETFLGVEGVDLQSAANGGTMETYGGTVAGEVQGSVGALGVRTNVAYTYIDGDIEDDALEGELPSVAPHAIKAGVELQLFGLAVAPRVIWLSEMASGADATVPASWVVNLAARYDNLFASARTPVSVFANVTNLFDQRFYHPPATDLGADFTMDRVPQDPFRLDGGILVEF